MVQVELTSFGHACPPPPRRSFHSLVSPVTSRAPATPTPLADQFLSTALPSDGVPWAHRSSPPTLISRGKSPGTPHHADTAFTRDGSSLIERFACGVPGCEHRFPVARLLGLHLRMGHTDFDLEKMKAARDGTRPTVTVDGLSITSSIDVGGRVR